MKVDDIEVTLLDGENLSGCTEAQADVYKLLLCLTQAKVESYPAKALSNQLGLRSPAPLWSRLKHLEEHGKIRMLQPAIV